MKKATLLFILFIIALLISNIDVHAQCSMCQAVVASNMHENEKTFGLGLNNAIIYLMVMPYLLIGAVGYLLYKRVKSSD